MIWLDLALFGFLKPLLVTLCHFQVYENAPRTQSPTTQHDRDGTAKELGIIFSGPGFEFWISPSRGMALGKQI